MNKLPSKIILWLLVCLTGLLFLAQGGPALAEEEIASIFMTRQAMERGYTISDVNQEFRLGIFSRVFTEAGRAKIVKMNGQDFTAPENKRRVSDVFLYDVSMPDPCVLEKPVAIALKINSSNLKDKKIYFWNRLAEKWQAIPSSIDWQNGYVRAYIHFPYSIVTVFEEQLDSPEVDILSSSALMMDLKTKKIIYEKNIDEERSIASLTKLATGLVFLQNNPDWNQVVTIEADDEAIGARLRINPGETLTTKNLFYTTFVGSANNAAKALARSTGLSSEEFVEEMNSLAQSLGLEKTHFVEPSGLDAQNISTAREIAHLGLHAFRFFEMLQGTTTKVYPFQTINTQKTHRIINQNAILQSNFYITGTKTGYTDEAGYCLLTKARDTKGNEVLTVILGSPNWERRFYETRELVNWAFDYYF
jgi:D-alanyl-D-alanine carboxypeptidase